MSDVNSYPGDRMGGEVKPEEEKWEEEGKEKNPYHEQFLKGAWTEGYLQACKVRQEEIERLKEYLNHPPFQSYGEALREGCDSDGAWNCFKENYRQHIKILLGEVK